MKKYLAAVAVLAYIGYDVYCERRFKDEVRRVIAHANRITREAA